MFIAVDFDGTCVKHAYPNIGDEIGAAEVLRKLVENGHSIILFTMRSHLTFIGERDTLEEAMEWFNKNNIPLYGVNENKSQYSWTHSTKPYAHLYIDDSGLGVPLKQDYPNERPYVDWKEVEKYLQTYKLI